MELINLMNFLNWPPQKNIRRIDKFPHVYDRSSSLLSPFEWHPIRLEGAILGHVASNLVKCAQWLNTTKPKVDRLKVLSVKTDDEKKIHVKHSY